jgi:hypothetical protein
MIIRFPFYGKNLLKIIFLELNLIKKILIGTSWIVFGINMFNMITCNLKKVESYEIRY